MIERVETTFAVKPERLIGDMAYGSAPMLDPAHRWHALEQRHLPFEPSRMQGLSTEVALLPELLDAQDHS